MSPVSVMTVRWTEEETYLKEAQYVGHHDGHGAGRRSDDPDNFLGLNKHRRLPVGAPHVRRVLLYERLDESQRLFQRVRVPGAGVQDPGAQGDVGQQLVVAVNLVQGVHHRLQPVDAVFLLDVPARHPRDPPSVDGEEPPQRHVALHPDRVRRVNLLGAGQIQESLNHPQHPECKTRFQVWEIIRVSAHDVIRFPPHEQLNQSGSATDSDCKNVEPLQGARHFLGEFSESNNRVHSCPRSSRENHPVTRKERQVSACQTPVIPQVQPLYSHKHPNQPATDSPTRYPSEVCAELLLLLLLLLLLHTATVACCLSSHPDI